jgi:hypothetical protein
LSRKRGLFRDTAEEDELDAMRYILQSTPILEAMQAAGEELKELKLLKESTPAGERTPEWETEIDKRIKACEAKKNALTESWIRFDREFEASEPTTRH